MAIVLEAFGRGLVVEPYLSTVVISAGLVSAAATGQRRKDILSSIAAGTLKLALAHGEAKARYALEHVEASARREGGDFVIEGAKAVVLGGDSADMLIVSARTDGGVNDKNGISLLLLMRKLPAFICAPIAIWMIAARRRFPSRMCACLKARCWGRSMAPCH